ncbi:hypothetical protein PTKIN_Ptkin04bG0099600 [Pterospermum kingtungense]
MLKHQSPLFVTLLVATVYMGTCLATAGEPILELYIHDILGGSGVAIPNANGALPTAHGINGLPLGTGLAGTAFAGNQNQNAKPQIPLDQMARGWASEQSQSSMTYSLPALSRGHRQ